LTETKKVKIVPASNIFSFFVLTQKNETKKSQDCARFARKISARTAKSSKLARSSLKQGRLLTLFSLIFRLTERGRSRVIKHIAKSKDWLQANPQVDYPSTCVNPRHPICVNLREINPATPEPGTRTSEPGTRTTERGTRNAAVGQYETPPDCKLAKLMIFP